MVYSENKVTADILRGLNNFKFLQNLEPDQPGVPKPALEF